MEKQGKLTKLQKHIAKILLETIIQKKEAGITYSDLARPFGINPHTVLPDQLGEISYFCYQLGLPLISAIVHPVDSYLPGEGLYKMCKLENIKKEWWGDAEEFLLKCLNEVWMCSDWSPLERYLADISDPVGDIVQTERIEGAPVQVMSTRYERDRSLRAECLRIWGTACKICGFDAAKEYGEQFAGFIHVHHRYPVSEAGKAHPVNPIMDLIPVCPNCHMILHAKKDGVFSPEEVSAMREAAHEKEK